MSDDDPTERMRERLRCAQEREYTIETAAKSAQRWNKQQARALPLFDQAGILDQVVEPRTAAQQLARRTGFLESYEEAMAEGARRRAERIIRYRAALAEAGADLAAIDEEWAARRGPKNQVYEATFYWEKVKQIRPGARWKDFAYPEDNRP